MDVITRPKTGARSPEKTRAQARAYYALNRYAKNQHDRARKRLVAAGHMKFHDDLKGRIASGQIDPNVFIERDPAA